MFSGIPFQITGNPAPATIYNQNITDKLAVAPVDMNYDPDTGIVTFSNPVLGSSAATLVGFHGVAGTARRASAAQAAVTATVGTDIAAFTDPPSAAEMALLRTFVNALKVDAAASIVLENELRAALVQKNLIKGAV